MSLRTGAHAGVAIRNTLILHSCHTGETDPHVASLLGMTFFMEIILPCVGAGFYPAHLRAAESGKRAGQSAAPTHTL